MLTLAIDTATPVGGVSIFHREDGIVGEMRLMGGKRHSEKLMKGIDFLLGVSDLRLDDIDFFTVSLGPGSFTGLRVGLSTVKGLAFALKKPVVGISTLEGFAYSFPVGEMMICPVFDARKGEVYTALFKREGGDLKRVIGDGTVRIEEFLREVRDNTLFAGNGATLYRERIIRLLGTKAFFAPLHLQYPLPSSISELAFRRAEKGLFDDPVSLSPVYMRRSEAEINTKRETGSP
ncbi:tRNA threonylcarbamoyladenosine biosynthesis protein TsaB [bacterium BMS3Bbin06]|nr:tRNA threonylcarbamoyladenosine biosynthesis protein TsaB [bacterium BMS3Abin08]GBE33679.1 tRNA threonylcarbamoyladenosine biosynthesis protein TsaB [bacterium BMS3Bbin06]HDH00613.1 tRNA (adenosine(37)-N6)-threonylcarbamoyltransferase complex dimerization subunit type 1 TsaB [Nitrospirota bacterium]HDO36196.1 tRNA (adenosine(37)-N6)-threonylcarbamoyltransferase complex dimerization subunit type 1 TsaB [Nitrospirota bacterium]HDY71033.1 tRNA (adenosine(37)-N6)-threonylcarbamoyltransferase com